MESLEKRSCRIVIRVGSLSTFAISVMEFGVIIFLLFGLFGKEEGANISHGV